MAVKLKASLLALQSFIAQSARFRSVTIGEPFSAPEGLSAAILLDNYTIPQVTLASTIERRTVIIRLYVPALTEPRESVEFALDDAVTDVIERFLGDADLGGDIREIHPTGITVRFAYTTIDQTIFRVADITIPMTVDDSASLAR